MKKRDLVDLIRFHSENNNVAFRDLSYSIAKEFEENGDYELAHYIVSLLADTNVFIPQEHTLKLRFLEQKDTTGFNLWLPDEITSDLLGILNAINHDIGVNRFLFIGSPGTGKTEATRQLARILGREMYVVNFASVVDSKLGQTQKNIAELFEEINSFSNPNRTLILFDELDALALSRTDSNDVREMGRATTELLKGFDSLNSKIVIIATTNLYKLFDKAILRRFDHTINFDRYSNEDLLVVAENILDSMLQKFKLANRDIRLFKKILSLKTPLPYPGDLIHIIKTAVAFSDPNDGTDYFRRLYRIVTEQKPCDIEILREQKFTMREIAILMNSSKSTVSRTINGKKTNE